MDLNSAVLWEVDFDNSHIGVVEAGNTIGAMPRPGQLALCTTLSLWEFYHDPISDLIVSSVGSFVVLGFILVLGFPNIARGQLLS